uniref:Multidrug resistance-associated protein 5 n=1 Tax=Tanacetum cinerariifolium TaxID=118510 RepID=A0A6L2NEZ7_TANCI|nr:multidrug resistance-associated protein 5 [Tanacetum cinerariifolium]
MDLSEYLSQAITYDMDDLVSKKIGPLKKRYCNDFSIDEMVNWAEMEVESEGTTEGVEARNSTTEGIEAKTRTKDKGKEKVSEDASDVVKTRICTVEVDTESEYQSDDDNDYQSDKSVDYLSPGIEELIELKNRMKANRKAKAKAKDKPDSEMNEPNKENSMPADNVRGETFKEHDIDMNELLKSLKTADKDGITEDLFISVEKHVERYSMYDETTHWRLRKSKCLIEAVKDVMPNAKHRHKTLLTMLEAIRVVVLERMNKMRKISRKWNLDVCLNIKKRLEWLKEQQRPKKKIIRVIGEGGSSTRVFKVGSQRSCSNYKQPRYNKSSCKEHVVEQTPKPKGVPGKPRKKQSVDDLEDVDVHRGLVRDQEQTQAEAQQTQRKPEQTQVEDQVEQTEDQAEIDLTQVEQTQKQTQEQVQPQEQPLQAALRMHLKPHTLNFSTIMDKIKNVNPNAHKYLMDKNPRAWSRAFFEVDIGYEAIENGFSECFNSVIVNVRHKTLLTMLEAIRVVVLERMNKMRKISRKWNLDVCLNIKKRLEWLKKQQRFWHVITVGGNLFEVRSRS